MAQYRTVEALIAVGQVRQYVDAVREHDRCYERLAREFGVRTQAPRKRARRVAQAPVLSAEVQARLAAACEASEAAVGSVPRVDLLALLERLKAA